MTNYFPFSSSQSLRKSLNKAFISFFPAMLTQQAVTSALNQIMSEPWGNAVFASLTVLFSRIGEANAEQAYAKSSLEALFLAKETNCQLQSAELLLANQIDAIDAPDKVKLQKYLTDRYDLDLSKPATNKLSELLCWAAKNDVFKMIAAGVICYYMPIPTANPILSKIFNASVASVTSYGVSLVAQCRPCQFFAAKGMTNAGGVATYKALEEAADATYTLQTA